VMMRLVPTQRIVLNTAKRVLRQHKDEPTVLAYK